MHIGVRVHKQHDNYRLEIWCLVCDRTHTIGSPCPLVIKGELLRLTIYVACIPLSAFMSDEQFFWYIDLELQCCLRNGDQFDSPKFCR